MDILIPLLFMAIFYLGPTLLKRYRAKNNAQPVTSERLDSGMMNAPSPIKKVAYKSSDTRVQSMPVVDKVQSTPPIVEAPSAWNGKLDQNIVTNGVIFAEILQAPRAYRPFVRH